MKRVAVLGSTGSIGRTTLQVIADFPDRLQATALSTRSRVDLLARQIADHHPDIVNVTAPGPDLTDRLRGYAGRLTTGVEGLVSLVEEAPADLLVVATVGAVGIGPTLAAIARGMDIALANKEVLVTAGELVMARAREAGVAILPVDSEHNAIAQCLKGEDIRAVRRILLTASGGPFRDCSAEAAACATPAEALNHPTWDMGPKISIDSATMMNKGFEVIEAMRLFDLPLEKIAVVIHPESVVHSMVEFVDGSVIAQLGPTDMYLPIQNVLLHPDRVESRYPPLDLAALGRLSFREASLDQYPCLALCFEAARTGGTMPAVLNAANEVAVEAFLKENISFGDIARTIAATMSHHDARTASALEAVEGADQWARQFACDLCNRTNKGGSALSLIEGM